MPKTWKRPSKILAANDLTPSSDLALDRATALAEYWGARLYVMHAVGDERLPCGEAAIEHEFRQLPTAQQTPFARTVLAAGQHDASCLSPVIAALVAASTASKP